jgi:hypothetical protein
LEDWAVSAVESTLRVKVKTKSAPEASRGGADGVEVGGRGVAVEDVFEQVVEASGRVRRRGLSDRPGNWSIHSKKPPAASEGAGGLDERPRPWRPGRGSRRRRLGEAGDVEGRVIGDGEGGGVDERPRVAVLVRSAGEVEVEVP